MRTVRLPRFPAAGVVAVVVALVAGACSDGGKEGATGAHPGSAPLVGTNWVLSRDTDLGVTLEGVTVSARFSARDVSGDGGCNTYRAPYERDGSSLTIGPDIATTLIGCDGPQASVERVYLQRLPKVRGYTIVGRVLTLHDGSGDVILAYRASGAEQLRGDWDVTSYYSGNAVQSVVGDVDLTARFTADTVEGNTGCNSFGGPVSTEGDVINVGPLTQTLAACADPVLQEQERHYVAALELATTYRVTGDRLELFRPDGGIAVTFTRG